MVLKIGTCEHIQNDLPTHGSVILKKTDEYRICSIFIRHSSWKMKGADKFCMISFWRQIEDSLLVLKIGSCEHTTNDLPTFSHKNGTLKSDRLNACFQFSEPRIGSLKSDRVNGPWEWHSVRSPLPVSLQSASFYFLFAAVSLQCHSIGSKHVSDWLKSLKWNVHMDSLPKPIFSIWRCHLGTSPQLYFGHSVV